MWSSGKLFIREQRETEGRDGDGSRYRNVQDKDHILKVDFSFTIELEYEDYVLEGSFTVTRGGKVILIAYAKGNRPFRKIFRFLETNMSGCSCCF